MSSDDVISFPPREPLTEQFHQPKQLDHVGDHRVADSLFPFTAVCDVVTHIGDCLDIISTFPPNSFDAIVTDPPYEIGYMAKAWDCSGIAFARDTWRALIAVLKPGGYLVAFSAPRVYHRLASIMEDCGLETYPLMTWNYQTGMPKPQNVSKLFDRDNCPDRRVTGVQRSAGYNAAQIRHGQQQYRTLEFATYEVDVSDEAKHWSGYYYGVNTLKPAFESIYLGQKPLAFPRAIDNLRAYGVGALNVGALRARHGVYPSNQFNYAKARQSEHRTQHPTVKPTALMEDLVLLTCPKDGQVLDPFAGTGTTGVACRRHDRRCTLIECDPAMQAVIQRRLLL
jgi:DNA modification methylase